MSTKCTLYDDNIYNIKLWVSYIITTSFSGFGGQLKLCLVVYHGKKIR